MAEPTTGHEIDPAGVNHPAHYNVHPSGVEAIDVCELMPFNIGNAVKYLMRADHKGTRDRDLDKAEWYLRRECDRRPVERYTVRGLTNEVWMWDQVVAAEPSQAMREIYLTIRRGDVRHAADLVRELDRVDAE